MKLNFGFLMLGALFFMASCGGDKPQSTETAVEETHEHEGHDHDGHSHDAEQTTYAVDAQASNVMWESGTSGVQVYSHAGNISVLEGSVMAEGDKIIGGSFAIDMTSIVPTDENFSEEHPAADLVGHLSTDDFFATADHPTANFEITSVEGTALTGNLTVRGTTNVEVVNLESIEVAEDGSLKAKGTLVFDRQKYGVAWAHYLKDVLLKDDISLQIDLVANK